MPLELTPEETQARIEKHVEGLSAYFKGENSTIAGVACLEFAMRLEKLNSGKNTRQAAAALIDLLKRIG